MLLLTVENAGEPLVQGFVRCRWPTSDRLRSGDVGPWARLFVRSAELWGHVQPLSVGIRIEAAPGQPLASVHSFVVPKPQEARLRRVIAAFLRTDEMAGSETAALQAEAELPGRFIHAGEPRFALSYEPLRTPQGLSIHYNLRLLEKLPNVIRACTDLGLSVAYEAQATPRVPPRALVRRALIEASALGEQRGVPPAIIRDQRALAERAKVGAYDIEECFSATGGASAADLLHALETAWLDTIYASFNAPPTLTGLDEAAGEAFAYHVHSSVMHGAPEEERAGDLSRLATRGDVDALMSCRALGLAAAVGPAGGDPGGFADLAGPAAPAPSGGGGGDRPFLFISYARLDNEPVNALVAELTARGVSLWIDRNLIGGEEWLFELERQLNGCAAVLACVSPNFVASKYCSREVHYADALGRPIVPVVLRPAKLERGLGLLMNPMQQIMLHAGKSYDDVLLAIKKFAPAAWQH
jgi:hypothetical protein